MKPPSIDTEGMREGIDALIQEGRKQRLPWWHWPLDFLFTCFYLVLFFAVIAAIGWGLVLLLNG